MTRCILAGCVVASLVACETSGPGYTSTAGAVFQPDVSVSVQFAPSTFFIGTPRVLACPAGIFSPSFALVITPQRATNQAIESATFKLIDGTTAGGPSVTFPQPQLTRMFGTTVIVDKRTFNFTPAFTCPLVLPRAMTADVVLSDGTPGGRHVTATMAVE